MIPSLLFPQERVDVANRFIAAISVSGSATIKLAIAADEEGAYIYEAIIPFKSFRLSKASIEDIGIGFETGKYVPPPSKTPGGSNPGASSGFGGYGRGSYGGGYGGGQGGYGNSGMRGSSRSGNSEISYSSSVWVTVKLK